MILTFMALMGFVSTALVLIGGGLFGYGYMGAGYIVAAIGAGWNGILYSSLLRWWADAERRATPHTQAVKPLPVDRTPGGVF
jgi:hypothetical protein